MGRVGASYANFTENVPYVLAVTLANALAERPADLSRETSALVELRAAQALLHCAGVSEVLVMARFAAFVQQLALLGAAGAKAAAALAA